MVSLTFIYAYILAQISLIIIKLLVLELGNKKEGFSYNRFFFLDPEL